MAEVTEACKSKLCFFTSRLDHPSNVTWGVGREEEAGIALKRQCNPKRFTIPCIIVFLCYCVGVFPFLGGKVGITSITQERQSMQTKKATVTYDGLSYSTT